MRKKFAVFWDSAAPRDGPFYGLTDQLHLKVKCMQFFDSRFKSVANVGHAT